MRGPRSFGERGRWERLDQGDWMGDGGEYIYKGEKKKKNHPRA